MGVPAVRAACRQLVAERGAELPIALAILEMLGDARDRQRRPASTLQPELARAALWARAFTGRAQDAEDLVTHLDEPALARMAADSFGVITRPVIEGPFAKAGDREPSDEVLADDAPHSARRAGAGAGSGHARCRRHPRVVAIESRPIRSK